jgi:hypothetical protein
VPASSPKPPTADDPSTARGPHLPDRWPVLLFVLFAAAAAWRSYAAASTTAWTPETLASFVLGVIPPVCSVLLPAALLTRHPGVGRRARVLLAGTLLFAAIPLFSAIEGSLQAAFTELTPPLEEVGAAPLALVYNGFQALLLVAGVLCLRLGLSRARHWAFTPVARAGGFLVLSLGAASAAATVVSYSQADLTDTTMTTVSWIYYGSSLALSVVVILAWSYLAMTLARGAISGEDPVAGWSAAALGSCLFVATFVISAWANLVQTPNETLAAVIYWLTTILYSMGYLGLLGGFVLGMPSLEPAELADAGDGARGRTLPDPVA